MDIEKVHKFLDVASHTYYIGSPLISDAQFDVLADMSGYNVVGEKPVGKIVKHWARLYSLQKVYSDEYKTPMLSVESKTVVSPKLDGAAISILYVGGQLVQVATRGDGIEGVDITDKFLNSRFVPLVIKTNEHILQVSGEIVAPSHVENARNYAAGALNLLDISEFKTRAITFFAHGISPAIHETYEEDMAYLQTLGFETALEPDIAEVYPTDGVVFRINDNKIAESYGYTAKHPKYAYALKERQEAVDTTLLAVEWEVGRTGRVTPIAILEPIKIGDKTISRATLNNVAFIKALDICIGDTLAVRLAGMIIPEVVHKVQG